MTAQTKAHLGLLGTNLFFAINISTVKYFTGNNLTGPYGLNLIRIGVSVILFWLYFLVAPGKKKLAKKDLLRFILCAFMALAVNQMLFMKGLYYTYSIHASLLLLITPIMITFIAAWLLKERITVLKIAGLLLGISGAIVLISSGKNGGTGNNVLTGDTLIILSASSYAIYFILVKPLMLKYPPMDVMRWVFTFGFVMVIPIGCNELSAISWNTFHIKDYILLFVIAVPGTFLAYIFNAYGIKVLSASIAGAYIYSQPVFAVIIATLFLHEHLEFYKIIAAVLIFSGVYLANKQVKND